MTTPPSIEPGFRAETGTHLFTAEEIIAFATKFDRQVFHLDTEKAKASVFGGLCASGWHTVAVWMRKQRDYTAQMAEDLAKQGIPPVEFGPSPGFEKLRWLKPVFAGDAITFFTSTSARRPSASRPGWHVLSIANGGRNQRGEMVMSFESTVFVRHPSV